jgi:predicted nucleic acid-binding protein
VSDRQLVLDASTAAKWLLPADGEDLIPEARNLLIAHERGHVEFFVPDLFWIEVASAVGKAIRRRRLSPEHGAGLVRDLLAYDLETLPSRTLIERAFAIASTHNCSVYDCIYVALAEEAGCDMITADERLVNALGSRFPVRWLGGMRF